MPSFVVLDTESSVCRDSNVRVLVSLAYEIVDVADGAVRDAHYDLVALPPSIRLDRSSQPIHGITPATSMRRGRALYHILRDFVDRMVAERPVAIVGHDVVPDAALLVSEGLRVGLPAARLRGVFRRLLCTKQLAVGHCGIPLPPHLRYDFPCDVLLHRLNGGGARPAAAATTGYKWPNLDECCHLLVGGTGARRYPCHDARGDVERCRLVLTRFLVDGCGP